MNFAPVIKVCKDYYQVGRNMKNPIKMRRELLEKFSDTQPYTNDGCSWVVSQLQRRYASGPGEKR
jgi:hypothetical protein